MKLEGKEAGNMERKSVKRWPGDTQGNMKQKNKKRDDRFNQSNKQIKNIKEKGKSSCHASSIFSNKLSGNTRNQGNKSEDYT